MNADVVPVRERQKAGPPLGVWGHDQAGHGSMGLRWDCGGDDLFGTGNADMVQLTL